MLLCCSLRAQELLLPERMTLSYINHPVIVQQVIPTVRSAYEILGIEVEFVEQPSARNLRQASAGITDGEVAYSDLLVASYPNLLLVEPAFFQSIFVLLCHRTEPCSQEILFDPNNTLVLTDASRNGLESRFGDRIKADMYSINSLKRIPRLIDGRRLRFGIYVTTQGDSSLADYPDLTSIVLFATKTHHVLNDKYSYIAPRVSEALSQVLKEKVTKPD